MTEVEIIIQDCEQNQFIRNGKMKKLITVLYTIALCLLPGCKQLEQLTTPEQENISKGDPSIVFWTYTPTDYGGPFEVTVNGISYGSITKKLISTPNCGSSGSVTVSLPRGYYFYSVGNEWIQSTGTLMMDWDGCRTLNVLNCDFCYNLQKKSVPGSLPSSSLESCRLSQSNLKSYSGAHVIYLYGDGARFGTKRGFIKVSDNSAILEFTPGGTTNYLIVLMNPESSYEIITSGDISIMKVYKECIIEERMNAPQQEIIYWY